MTSTVTLDVGQAVEWVVRRAKADDERVGTCYPYRHITSSLSARLERVVMSLLSNGEVMLVGGDRGFGPGERLFVTSIMRKELAHSLALEISESANGLLTAERLG